jgi:hypothetical protein
MGFSKYLSLVFRAITVEKMALSNRSPTDHDIGGARPMAPEFFCRAKLLGKITGGFTTFLQSSHMRTMVRVYLPAKLGDFWGKCW